MWLALNRAGIPVAWCTVERLVGNLGLRGAVRGKVKRTTIAGAGPKPADLVGRNIARWPRAGCGWLTSLMSLATGQWVDWYNRRRLNEYCGDMPPAVVEQVHHAQQQPSAAS